MTKRLVLCGKWLLLCGSLALTACGGQDAAGQEHEGHHDHATEAPHGEGPEYTSAYVCPMHCEGSGSEEPGQCPVCGMDYVPLAEHTGDGHSHEEM